MNELNPVVLSLYRAAHEVPLAEFQDAALRLVKSYVRLSGCKWGASVIDEQGVLFQSVYFHEDDPEGASTYNEVRNQDRAALWAINHRGQTGNFHFASFYDRRSAIGDYTHRYRHSNALITGLPSVDDRLIKSVSIYRGDPEDTFSERDRRAVECLVPHLNEALTVSRLLAATRFRAGAERQWAVAIMDHAGPLQFADPEFEALVQAEWPSGAVRRIPGNAHAAIMHGDGSTQYTGRTLIMRSTREAGITFVRARARLPADGLTQRELSVVQAIARGYTHKEIARLLHLSPATVRNQIQTVHNRLGVGTNAELVAVLLRAGY
ncbi:helix-turn-helix transcriptional regulator [Trinickia symbiotica]|nr:LuxR C-terminal-related transcriptional regulator [Trinickia symbiotica]